MDQVRRLKSDLSEALRAERYGESGPLSVSSNFPAIKGKVRTQGALCFLPEPQLQDSSLKHPQWLPSDSGGGL